MNGAPTRVLFVCLGNICRSPAAEGLLLHHLKQEGLEDQIEVDSAGTGSWHTGERADPRMRKAAQSRGVELPSRARQVQRQDFERFELIVAMDRDNLANLRQLAKARPGQLFLFSDLLGEGWPQDVPDPYYGGPEGFEAVLDMLSAGLPALTRRALAAKAAAT